MGLGIRFVGERTAELLAQEFGSIDAIIAAGRRVELEQVADIGPAHLRGDSGVLLAAGQQSCLSRDLRKSA